MKLSEKKLKELKEKKILIEELNEKYFYTKKAGINVENILKLLNESICPFEEIVDKYKSISEISSLLFNKELFEELNKNNILTQENLGCLLNRIDNDYELHRLDENTILLKCIVESGLFQELVDTFRSIKDERNALCLKYLLENKKLFKELIENNKLNKEDTRYLLNRIDDHYELANLNENTFLLKYIVDKDILSFKDLVDKFKSIKNHVNDPCLYKLLWNKKLFEELIQNNRLSAEDLRYLLNRIDKWNELDKLCDNTSLLKYILNEFVLNNELVDKLNTIIEKDEWCKNRNIHTIFDRIEDRNKNNEEILKLNELNRIIYSFDLNEEQRLEVYELIQNNEIAFNRLLQIVDNNLESNYNFESLMSYLKKTGKKNILNI